MIGSVVYGQEYQNISIDDGLPSNNVYRIAQDAAGFIWFITDKGMAKYDGEHLKLFTTKQGLPINDIWNIRTTPDGKVWYFSKSRELGYIYNDEVYSFPSENEGEILIPNVIFQDGNKIGFDKDGLVVLKDGKWQRIRDATAVGESKVRHLLGNQYASYFLVDSSADRAKVYHKGTDKSWSYSWDRLQLGPIFKHGQISSDYYGNMRTKSANIVDFVRKQNKVLLYQDLFDKEISRYLSLIHI